MNGETLTPETGNWRLRHQIDRIYGHLPTVFYSEVSKAANASKFLNTIKTKYTVAVADISKEFNVDMIGLLELISKSEELTKYFFDRMKAMSEVKDLTNVAELAEA